MDDEDSKNDSLKHNSPAGANAEEAAVAGLDGKRCDAASDRTRAMQNTGEKGPSGAAGSEKGTDTDTWETINSLVKQVCCPLASIDQESGVGGGGGQYLVYVYSMQALGQCIDFGIDFCGGQSK